MQTAQDPGKSRLKSSYLQNIVFPSLFFIFAPYLFVRGSSNTHDTNEKCDGRRPKCINCDESGNECTYRDQAEFSPEAGRLVVEVVKILNSLPTKDAIWTLQLLSGEANAPTIMSTLRDKTSITQKLAGDELNIPETRLEFEMQHPVAYPSLALVSPSALTIQPLADKLPSNRDGDVNSQ